MYCIIGLPSIDQVCS